MLEYPKKSCCKQFAYFLCLIITYLFTLMLHIILISLYPVIVILDIFLILVTINYYCTRDQYAFFMTFSLMNFHI